MITGKGSVQKKKEKEGKAMSRLASFVWFVN